MILTTRFALTEFCPFILFWEFDQLSGLVIPAFPPPKNVPPVIATVPSASAMSPSVLVFAPHTSIFPPDINILPLASIPSDSAFTYISPP